MGSRRGYILLTTLLLIALAGAAMVGVSRRSLQRSLDASRAEDELQRRWGLLSVQSTLLPKAGNALQLAERREKRPLAFTSFELRLGRQEFLLTVFDEQAKLNVNTLHRRKAGVETERVLRQLLPGDAPPDALDLRPLPASIDPVTKQAVPPFQSFGQVFSSATSPRQLLGDVDYTGWSRAVTLWSDGKLNYRRASPEVLQLACAPTLNSAQVQSLLSLREQPERASLAAILPQLQLTRARRAQVEALLTEGSSCHSMWIVVQTPRRRWYHLAVSPPGDEGKAVYFEW